MKFPILIAFFLVFILLAFTFILYTQPVSATCRTQASNPRVQDGLISTTAISDNFGSNIGKCIEGNQASFAPFKIPSYADLKSLYFDQAKSPRKDTITGDATQGDIVSKINSGDGGDVDHLISVTGSLTINSNGFLTGKPNIPIIIFAQNSLNISKNIDFADTSSSGGLVFVVSGNVNIDPAVTGIDAVIISQGTIYTAGADCATSNVPASPLTINGSLISLDSTKPPVFCRTLGTGNNTGAAEIIKQQPKYLVILRDLFSDTLQKWSEIQ